METVVIGLKEEALKYLADYAVKDQTDSVISTFSNKSCDGDELTPIDMLKYEDAERRKIYELAQHTHFDGKKMVVHKCLIIGDPNKGQLIGAWTDAEAQVAYDRELEGQSTIDVVDR